MNSFTYDTVDPNKLIIRLKKNMIQLKIGLKNIDLKVLYMIIKKEVEYYGIQVHLLICIYGNIVISNSYTTV